MTRRRVRYADPSERVRFGSMRYIPSLALSTANPNVFHVVTNGAQNDYLLPTPSATQPAYQGQTVWVTYFTGGGGNFPSWVLNDNTVQAFPGPNVANGIAGDGTANFPTISAWSIAVPANAKAVRIGASAPHIAALVIWLMGSVNAAKMGDGSGQPAPDHFVPAFTRTQAYVIAACISAIPGMDTVPGFDMGVSIDGARTLLGATHNTPGVLFPVTYTGAPNVGFYQWCTDSQPPIVP